MTETTQSLCPECLSRIDARRVIRGQDAFLEKTCPVHGFFSTPIWRGAPLFADWKRPKIPKAPPVLFQEIENGCPFDCGLCPDHRQRSCTVLLEVTGRCDLRCPVCYADSGNAGRPDPSLDIVRGWFDRAREAAGDCNIQLSGGEPAVRDDLPEIVAMGKAAGFGFIQVNTNGLRAARDDGYVRALRDAGLASVFLQFDGVDDRVYRKLRGRALIDDKRAAIAAFGAHDIGVVLVPTLVPGVNTDQAGAILAEAIRLSPVVRAVHFQPVSYFGRYPRNGEPARLTLPELMRAIAAQTGGLFPVSAFKPPGCENARCSFHGNFMTLPDGRVVSLQKTGVCCGPPVSAETGASQAIACVARQWASPPGARMIPLSPIHSGCNPPPEPAGLKPESPLDLDAFIARARTHTLSVSAMAFQDAWNLDIDRVRDCCIHVMSPDGRLVPFCLYNLTAANGKRLYRP